MLGSRSIVYDDWKATTDHVSQGVVDEERLLEGSRDFDDRPVGAVPPRRRLRRGPDVADAHPEVLARAPGASGSWKRRATRCSRSSTAWSRASPPRCPRPNPTASRCVYRPTGSPVPDDSVPRLFGGFRLTAAVDVRRRAAEGVLCRDG